MLLLAMKRADFASSGATSGSTRRRMASGSRTAFSVRYLSRAVLSSGGGDLR